MRRLAALLLLLASPASAQAADQKIAETTTSQVVAAHGGRLAWSDGDRLMTWANGIASVVPVAPQAGGFDVDLGKGPGGNTVAVYSRDAGLFLFDFDIGREIRLERLSRPGVREQGPVIDRRRIAFFRGTANRRGLYLGTIPSGRLRMIRNLPREIGPYDLQGRKLAYTRGRFAGDRFTDTLFLHDVFTARRRVVARVSSGLLSSARFAGPSFGGGYLYVARVRTAAAGNRFMRVNLRTLRSREVMGRKGIVEAAFARGRAFYLTTSIDGTRECTPCTLSLTPRLAF